MLGEPERVQEGDVWMVERAIVLQILSDDHEQHCPRSELKRAIYDVEPATLERALVRLEHEGVLHLEGSGVRASRAVRRLDELELVGL
jgi:DNA-binding HxlR family transcriptional regulator